MYLQSKSIPELEDTSPCRRGKLICYIFYSELRGSTFSPSQTGALDALASPVTGNLSTHVPLVGSREERMANYAASPEYSRSSPTVEAQKTGAGPGAEGVRSWMENPKALRKHPRPLTAGLPT